MSTPILDLARRNLASTPAHYSSGGQPIAPTRQFLPRLVNKRRSHRPADIPVTTCLAWFVLSLAFALFVAWRVLS